MSTEKRQFTLRLREDIHDKIKLIAEENRRSLTMQIEYVLEKYIKEYENDKDPQ